MRIPPSTTTSRPAPTVQFGGHFAAPLKGLYFQLHRDLTTHPIMEEVQEIGKQEGFRVAVQRGKELEDDLDELPLSYSYKEGKHVFKTPHLSRWGQDSKLILADEVLGPPSTLGMHFKDCEQGGLNKRYEQRYASQLAKGLGLPYRKLTTYLEGGNVFLHQPGTSTGQALVGDHSVLITSRMLASQALTSPRELVHYIGNSIKSLWRREFTRFQERRVSEFQELAKHLISQDLKIPEAHLHTVPQADFHLDMTLRPLAFPTVLVNTQAQTDALLDRYEAQQSGLAPGHPLKHPSPHPWEAWAMVRNMRFNLEYYHRDLERRGYVSSGQIIERLRAQGLEPIEIGGTFCGSENENLTLYPVNFLNATVHQRPDGSLVYITNDSGLPGLNHLFEEDLRKKVPNLAEVRFISGGVDRKGAPLIQDSLKKGGGIHCLAAEQPAK